MLLEDRIAELITPSISDMGYDLVRVQYRGETRKTLQIMAERKDQCPMTVNDCEALSETISALMDVADPIRERYALEVSSPGIDRPLMKPADFARFIGFAAKVSLNDLYEGRRQLEGLIKSVDGDNITMELEKETGLFTFPFSVMRRAKLVLTDELIDYSLREQDSAIQAANNNNPTTTDSTES